MHPTKEQIDFDLALRNPRRTNNQGAERVKTNPFIWVQLTRYLWVLFLLYWIVSARKLKTVKRREPPNERIVYILFMAATHVLMFNERMEGTWLSARFLPLCSRIGAIGFALAVAGIALAFWARGYLGENWSATVTLKQGHELIRSGPYRRIRHRFIPECCWRWRERPWRSARFAP